MKPYFDSDGVTIYHGDCRDVIPSLGAVDLVLTDPPYGDTSLDWDTVVHGWLGIDAPQMWCFGSMRFWLGESPSFLEHGWQLAQDVVWEKHNGSSFHADRFRRVHEHVLHWYRGQWSAVPRTAQTTPDAVKRRVRRTQQHTHTGAIDASTYQSLDGGPRLMRSVMKVRSCHGSALHPTQKPLGIVLPLLAYSLPPGGVTLDPFMGSGTTLRAAKDLGQRAIGIEVDERYCEIAAERMAQRVLPFPSPSLAAAGGVA